MTTSSPKSALESIRTVEFTFALRGYKTDEVDEFLEKAAVEVDALRDQLRQTSDRLRQAAERIAQLEASRREAQAPTPAAAPTPAPAPAAAPAPVVVPTPAPATGESTEELQKTLVLAQRFVDQTKREAEAEAAAMIAKAEEEAKQITTQAQTRLRDEVGRLETVKGQLTSEVEGLATKLDVERIRLRGQFEEFQRWIEEHVQPSAALRAIQAASAPTPAADPATDEPEADLQVS